jgi:hypothetical protein
MHSHHAAVHHVTARQDPALRARVVRRVPMFYAAGADRSADRPAHVRAGSGLAWCGERLAVVQDDANFIALVDPATGLAEAVALPTGAGGLRLFDTNRGNKAEKLDLETLTSIPSATGDVLVALGSGSTAKREQIAILENAGSASARVQLHHLPEFYAQLRASTAFSGSELNIEGALHCDGRLTLFGRGNGAPRAALQPVDATCEVDWVSLRHHLEQPQRVPPPPPGNVCQYSLGSIDGTRLSFTDATLAALPPGTTRRILYTAAAEASPDAVRDGAVSGSALGYLGEQEGSRVARWTRLEGAGGESLALKAEGVAWRATHPAQAFVVMDGDSWAEASELCEVELSGFW